MTKQFSNYSDLLTFTRASKGHALRPVSYGDELVTNGTFDSDATGATPATWETNNANASLVKQADGTALFSSTSFAYARVQAASRPVLSVGLYRVSFEISEWSGSLSAVHVGLNATGNIVSGSGTYSYIYTSTAEQAYEFQIRPNGGGTGSFKIDNISVKEVLFDQPDGTLTLFEHPNNIPRVEYDADGNRLGLLVEEARTNLIPYSEDLTASGWSSSGSTTIGQQQTTNEYLGKYWPVSLSSAVHEFYQFRLSSLLADGTQTAMSVLIRTASGEGTRTIRFKHGRDSFFVDKSIGEQWQVVSTVNNSSGATKEYFGISSPDGSACNVEVQFFQLEAGSFPTSYIKNEGTPSGATRSADVATIPVADFGFNQSAGTFVATASLSYNPSEDERYVIGTDSASRRWIYKNDVLDELRVFDGTTTVTSAVEIEASQTFKVGVFSDSSTKGIVTNGETPVTNATNSDLTSLTSSLKIGNSSSSNNQLNGHIKSIQYYPRRLSNAQLVDLTS